MQKGRWKCRNEVIKRTGRVESRKNHLEESQWTFDIPVHTAVVFLHFHPWSSATGDDVLYGP